MSVFFLNRLLPLDVQLRRPLSEWQTASSITASLQRTNQPEHQIHRRQLHVGSSSSPTSTLPSPKLTSSPLSSSPRNDSFVGRPRSRSPLPRFERRSRSPPSHRLPPPRQHSPGYGNSRFEAGSHRQDFNQSSSRVGEERGRGRLREDHGLQRNEGPSERDSRRREVNSVLMSGVMEVTVKKDEESVVLGLELGGDASLK